jgi:hypothetical protein
MDDEKKDNSKVKESSNQQRQRSPRYPSSNLESCIEKLHVLQKKIGKSTALRDEASVHLGLTPRTGGTNQLFASMAQFGLIQDAGVGMIRITALGIAITTPMDVTEFAESAKSAFFTPKIFQSLYSEHGNPPSSEGTIYTVLLRAYDFQMAAARECARTFLSSLNYIHSLGSILEKSNATNETEEEVKTNAQDTKIELTSVSKLVNNTANIIEGESIQNRLSKRTSIQIIVNGPIGSDEEKRLKLWLEKVLNPWLSSKAIKDQFEDFDDSDFGNEAFTEPNLFT